LIGLLPGTEVGQIDPVSALRRAINLISALALVAIGGGGLFYIYFLTATPNGWMALAAGIAGAAGFIGYGMSTSTRTRDRRSETMHRGPKGERRSDERIMSPRFAT
jgi:hypothetical protein